MQISPESKDTIQKIVYSDGSKFVGTVVRTGYGVFTGSDGSTYKGYWKNDMKNGHGKKTFADGNL